MHLYKKDIYFGIVIIILSVIGILCHPFLSRLQTKSFGRSLPALIFNWTPEKEEQVGKILNKIVGVLGIIVGIPVCLGVTW